MRTTRLLTTTALCALLPLALPAAADWGLGGELVIVSHQDNQSMQAQTAFKEINSVGIRNVLEQLTTLNIDTGELEPMLATSWEWVDDHTWRFQLREGVTFHDGSPFDAEAAAISIEWVWSPENNYVIRSMAGPDFEAKAIDTYTLEVVTAEPDPLFAHRMYLTGISSARQILENPAEHDVKAIGTGPYVFEAWEPGQYFLMSANPDWWGHEAEDAYGEVFFESVRVVPRSEASVRTAMVESREAHIAMFLTAEDCERFRADPALDCLTKESDTYFIAYLDYTDAHPSLADPRLREAFHLAVDAEAIREHIIVLAQGTEGQLLGDTAVGFHEGLSDYGYDPDRAEALLEEARAGGVEIPTLHIATRIGSHPRNGEVIEVMAGMLAEIGWPAEVAIEDPSVFNVWANTRPDESRANVMVHPMSNPLNDYAISFRSLYHCGRGVSKYCDEAFDAALAEAETLGGEARHEALRELVEHVHDDHVLMSFGLLEQAYGVPAGFEWEFGIDHRMYAVHMRYEP
jgi:peptide/nickel transport system substrate-binding protein